MDQNILDYIQTNRHIYTQHSLKTQLLKAGYTSKAIDVVYQTLAANKESSVKIKYKKPVVDNITWVILLIPLSLGCNLVFLDNLSLIALSIVILLLGTFLLWLGYDMPIYLGFVATVYCL